MNFLGKALYTLTLSDFQSSFSSSNPQFGEVTQGDALPYVPQHQGTFLGGIQWAPWALNLSVTYVGAMRDVAGEGEIIDAERIDARWVTDLTSNIEVIDNLHLYLTINNLFDEKYMVARRPFGARPGRPFQALVGLKYHLGQ
jgi:Fe(3+) dicitrate transport protein